MVVLCHGVTGTLPSFLKPHRPKARGTCGRFLCVETMWLSLAEIAAITVFSPHYWQRQRIHQIVEQDANLADSPAPHQRKAWAHGKHGPTHVENNNKADPAFLIHRGQPRKVSWVVAAGCVPHLAVHPPAHAKRPTCPNGQAHVHQRSCDRNSLGQSKRAVREDANRPNVRPDGSSASLQKGSFCTSTGGHDAPPHAPTIFSFNGEIPQSCCQGNQKTRLNSNPTGLACLL